MKAQPGDVNSLPVGDQSYPPVRLRPATCAGGTGGRRVRGPIMPNIWRVACAERTHRPSMRILRVLL